MNRVCRAKETHKHTQCKALQIYINSVKDTAADAEALKRISRLRGDEDVDVDVDVDVDADADEAASGCGGCATQIAFKYNYFPFMRVKDCRPGSDI